MGSRWMLAAGVVLAPAAVVLSCTAYDAQPADPADAQADAPSVEAGETGHPGDASTGADAGRRCRSDDPFGQATLLAGVNDGANVVHPRLTPDELEIFYEREFRIFVARRGSKDLPFGAGEAIPLPDAAVTATDPSVSADSRALHVSLNKRLARMSRPARTAPFGEHVFLYEEDDGGATDSDPHVLADERALYFRRLRTAINESSIWRAGGDGDGGFGAPVAVPIGSGGYFHNPSVSEDELELYIAVDGAGLHRSIRASTGDPFPAPVPVVEINAQALGGGNARPGWLSPDGCRMYFASGTTTSQIYVAVRTPR